MKVKWRQSAIESLINLDQWSSSIELPSIGMHLKNTVQVYFERHDFSMYVLGDKLLFEIYPLILKWY
jgi:hypothetical protein